MKLTFKKITVKNFRSVSNHTIEVDFTRPSTLITSTDNGCGKSTITIHALAFALFGKPYGKGQKKGSLVNTRNGRECLVELYFSVGAVEYVVRRGIKPDFFEIYQDGKLIDQDASGRDYQAVLNQIIQIDEKILYNLVLVGRDKFVPFAEMSASERRHYGETMLDLSVFTKMNDVNKEDIKQVEMEVTNAKGLIFKSQTEISAIEGVLASLNKSKANHVSDLTAQIDQLQNELSVVSSEKAKLRDEVDGIVVPSIDEAEQKVIQFRDAYNTLMSKIAVKHNEKQSLSQQIRSIDHSSTCKSCGQSIDNTTALRQYNEAVSSVDVIDQWLSKAEQMKIDINNRIDQWQQLIDNSRSLSKRVDQIMVRIGQQDYQIKDKKNQIERLEQLLNQPTNFDADIALNETEKTQKRKHLDELVVSETELLRKLDNKKTVGLLLKDDGIKSAVVDRYLPYLNERINSYLEKMNLGISIVVDKEFELHINSPDRKNQTLADLSTGQMRRIDLASMLSWRDIGQVTSSVSTNILILDETLENLSSQGVNDFIEFYRSTFQETSLFVVSQRRDEFLEYFDEEIYLTMDSEGFTKVIKDK